MENTGQFGSREDKRLEKTQGKQAWNKIDFYAAENLLWKRDIPAYSQTVTRQISSILPETYDLIR